MHIAVKNWQLHPARIGECDKIVNFCDTQWRSNLQEGPIWGESVAIAYGQGDRSCANFSFFFNSYIRYLVVLLRFVAMYAFFGEFGQKKSVFWAKSAQKQFYGVWSALLTKFAFTRKNKRRFCCENSKYVPDFCGHFCDWQKSANFCHPSHGNVFFRIL